MQNFTTVFMSMLMASLATASFAATPEGVFTREESPRRVVSTERASDGLILNPEGTSQAYIANGNGYTMLGNVPANMPITNLPVDFVKSESKIYLKDIVPVFSAGTYVEGSLEGNKITVEFPQSVAITKSNGVTKEYFAQILVPNPDEYKYADEAFVLSDDRSTVEFTIKEDGTVEMEKSAGEWIIGITDEKSMWQCYGAYDMVYDPMDYKLTELPEGVETETWEMITEHFGHNIEIGFTNENVYIKGFTIYAPDAWTCGTLEGDKITIKAGSYLGVLDDLGLYGFLFPGEPLTLDSGRLTYQIKPDSDITFTYDKEKKQLLTEDIVLINNSDRTTKWCEKYVAPFIHKAPETHSLVPEPITPVAYLPYNSFDHYGGFQFYMPNYSEDLCMLEKERLYYMVYIDEELLTFTPDLYSGFMEETDMAPYTMDCPEMWNVFIPNDWSGPLHTFLFFEPVQKSIGIVCIYKDEDGKEYRSEMALTTFEDGIDDIESGADSNAPAEYYDLFGHRLSNPEPGTICIERKGNKVTKRIISK